jgi:hypothetical protein
LSLVCAVMYGAMLLTMERARVGGWVSEGWANRWAESEDKGGV